MKHRVKNVKAQELRTIFLKFFQKPRHQKDHWSSSSFRSKKKKKIRFETCWPYPAQPLFILRSLSNLHSTISQSVQVLNSQSLSLTIVTKPTVPSFQRSVLLCIHAKLQYPELFSLHFPIYCSYSTWICTKVKIFIFFLGSLEVFVKWAGFCMGNFRLWKRHCSQEYSAWNGDWWT